LRRISEFGGLTKLEIGCGHRPSEGYIHNDINAFEGVDLVGGPWEIDLEDRCLDEVIALACVEHLTYGQVHDSFVNVRRMLKPGGVFLFDVPDIPVWCSYVVDHFAGKPIPCTIEHAMSTLYGWQRWPGDEHKSGWYRELLDAELRKSGFSDFTYDIQGFLSRGLERNRMKRAWDAHLYCIARRTD
jgi:predicted SAM-dependent methyltransferase